MNREIKFRAYWSADKKMEYWDEMLEVRENALRLYFVGENPILMQYTGFKDINSKDIYEGDIVKIDGKLYTNHEVRFEEDEGGFCPMLEVTPLLVEWEVVGNIYETPEFLGGGE